MGKNKAFHRTAAAVICAAAVLVGGMAVSGTSGTDYDSQIAQKEAEIEKMQKENDARQAEIEGYNGDINENEQMISLIAAQIDSVKSEIISQNQLIDMKQTDIDKKGEEIAKAEQGIADKEEEIRKKRLEIEELSAENDDNLAKFSKLARVLYMNDTSDTIPLLSGSDDWYNFFVYSDVIRNISGQNMEFMQTLLANIKSQENKISDLNDEIADLENDKKDLENDKAKLEEEKAGFESEKARLEADQQDKYTNLYNVSAANDSLLNRVASLEYAKSATDELIEEANREIEALVRKKQAENSGQTVYSTDGFRWPLDSRFQMLTTYFGPDYLNGKYRNHYGIDVGNAGIGGQNIYAAQSGTVITAYNDGAWHGGYGNYVVIDHGAGISTLYAHCSATTVYEGQVVNKGDIIGYVGTTGWSTGNHLHFEVRVDGTATDPLGYAYEYID